MPDDFFIAEKFKHGLTDVQLKKGMNAYRDFLYALFDKLSASKNKIDVKTGAIYDPYTRALMTKWIEKELSI
jgi:hypothetical protein